jgi:hypothetical protein
MSAYYDKEWEIEQLELAIMYFEHRRQQNGVLADAAIKQVENLTQKLDDLRTETNLNITKDDWQQLAWAGSRGK